MTAQQIFARGMKTVRILWGALTFSNVLVGVMSFQVKPPPGAQLDPTMEAVFFGLAVAVAVVSFVVPARAYATTARRLPPPRLAESEPTPGGARGPGRFAHEGEAAGQAMGLSFMPFILSMAMSEAVTLLGLIIHVQGAPTTHSLALIAAGTLLAAIRLPTLPRLVGPYERLHGASFAAPGGGSY